MYNNLPEKYLGSVITFGDRGNITASATTVVKSYLAAPGGTGAATIEFAVTITRKGMLRNLFWSAETSTLTANGNSVTVYVKESPTQASSAATGLAATWNSSARSGFNSANSVIVNAGSTVSVFVQLAKGSGTISRLRVSLELEVEAQEPNPWNLKDKMVSYAGGNVGIGTSTPKTTLDVKGAISGFGIVPVGSIMAWHKSFELTPALSDGWMECNGQVVEDAASVYNGKNIPDLNNSGRFLRGALVSGKMQEDAFQGHHHQVENGNNGGWHEGGPFQNTWGVNTNNARVTAAVSDGKNGTPRIANETRPVNMAVVWIMRIK